MGSVSSRVFITALLVSACGSEPQATEDSTGSSEPTEGPAPIEGCDLPIEINQVGAEPPAPTGFVRCNDGEIHRAEAVECLTPLPTGIACDGQMGSCDTDADCVDGPHGACLYVEGFFAGCACVYGCATDADCGEGQICACGGSAPDYPDSTQCIDADCVTDSDCGTQPCALGSEVQSCGDRPLLGCRTDADACTPLGTECGDDNCLPPSDGEPWACAPPSVCADAPVPPPSR